MNSFEREWPVTLDLSAHQEQFELATKAIDGVLHTPADGRLSLAYGNHMQGGPTSFTVLRGEATVGKTAYHNMVFGEDRRVSIQPQDTEASLFGHSQFERPTQGKVTASEDDPNFYLNEVSQIENPSALGVIGDGDTITTANGSIPLERASIGATDNLWRPGQRRVQRRDSAMDSRWRTNVLVGGIDMSGAQAIHGLVAEKANATPGADSQSARPDGLIPNIDAKLAIQEAVARSMPADPKEVRVYMPKLIETVLSDPAITTDSLQKEAARITEGAITAARSLKFAEGSAATFEKIGKDRLSQVASLTVAGVVRIGSVGNETLAGVLDELDGKIGAFDAEVVLRRLVAAYAQKVAWDMNTTGNLTEEKLRLHMEKYSFATTGDPVKDAKIDDYIVRTVFDNGKVTRGASDEPTGTRKSSRRRFRKNR